MLQLDHNRKLTLGDIADLRAYERERTEFQAHVRARKQRRRVHVGDFITFTFECADTVRYQIQEMARVEKLYRDEQIESELAAYNPLIPGPGALSATMFVELTSKIDLMHWLPLLVGIERSAYIELSDGTRVRAVVEAGHQAQLTREDITSSVHYIRFEFGPEQVQAFSAGPVVLGLDHDHYQERTELSGETTSELNGDLLG
jgi:hypothetical protein